MKRYNQLGAQRIEVDENIGKIKFSIFLPEIDANITNIEKIFVIGDFQNIKWDESSAPELKLNKNTPYLWESQEIKLNKGFYEYHYLVKFTNGKFRRIGDPYTKYGGKEFFQIDDHYKRKQRNSGFTIGGSSPTNNKVNMLSERKPVKELVIYELMIDDFTEQYKTKDESMLEAVNRKLDYIQNYGFNAILFMPWTAWNKNSYNWGYEPYYFFSVAHRYVDKPGYPEEKISFLKQLINECHLRNIHVIMDGVFNHVDTDFPYRHFYQKNEINYIDGKPDYSNCDSPFVNQTFHDNFLHDTLIDLNFYQNCTYDFIKDVCLYWIQEFKIDGIRFDCTKGILKLREEPEKSKKYIIVHPQKGLAKLIKELKQIINEDDSLNNFSLTIEHLDNSASILANKLGISYWDKSIYEILDKEITDRGTKKSFVEDCLGKKYLKDLTIPTIYLTSHDHEHLA